MSVVEVIMTVCLLTAIETCEEKHAVFGPFIIFESVQLCVDPLEGGVRGFHAERRTIDTKQSMVRRLDGVDTLHLCLQIATEDFQLFTTRIV